jgi:glyoxylase-like metal-dependent hydrolase (beta-lactamase superfamily II)
MTRSFLTRFAVAGTVMAVSVALSAQRGAPPDPIVHDENTTKVAAHTYVIPDGSVPLVPNVGIIVGSQATLVIDPGLGRRNGEAVLRAVRRVSQTPDLFIVSTHFHAEHTTGYGAFPASATYVNSTIQEEEFAQRGMQMVQMFSGRSPATAELLKDASRRTADITFDRSHVIDLGGVHVRCLVVGPTHTLGDTAFFIEEDGVLFAGDVVMNESFLAANDGSSVSAWLAAFDTFEALRPRTIVPSHGNVGAGGLIGANRAVVRAVRAQARALKARGRTADEAAAAVQAALVAQHPGWPRANGLAALARSAYNEP